MNASMPRSGRWLNHFLRALRGAFSMWCGFNALFNSNKQKEIFMSIKIQLQELYDENEEVKTLVIIDSTNNIIADLSKTSNEEIIEADIIDDNFIEGHYTSYTTDYECIALFDNAGKLIRKGIYSIENYIESRKEFIILVVAQEGEYYEFYRNYRDAPDFLHCVIDELGDYIIEPTTKNIEYLEENDKYSIF